MTPLLASRDRRALTIGTAVIATAWLLLRGSPLAVASYRELALRADLVAAQRTEARALIAVDGALRDSLAECGAMLLGWAPRLIAGRTRAEAEAELAFVLHALVSGGRVHLTRIDPAPDSAVGLFRVVALRVAAESDVAGLSAWLERLDRATSLVRIREAAISAADPLAPSGQAEVLRAELTIEGWAALRGDSAGRRQ